MTLPADVNRPGSQEDLVNNWEPARSLVEDAVSGAKIVPFWLCRLPASLPLAGDGPICSYSLSPLFREWARKCLRLELFVGKFSLSLFLSLSVYPTVWVAVL